ncbi:MAG: hypothetical protein E7384_08115 [Ruminococcaceae bacterium]|nr:hypothetical protein [Oscillospiraceae bacterium]
MKNFRRDFIKKSIIFIALIICFGALLGVTSGAAEGYSIKTVKASCFVGGDVEFEFSGSKSAADWVGICKSDVKSYRDNNLGIWLYLGTGKSGDVAPMTDAVAKGSYSLKTVKPDGTNLPMGEYSLVFMTSDSFNEVARCNFKIVDLPLASDIPKVENITLSKDNKDLKFALPESCSVNDGYSVLLYWADKDGNSLGSEPFYSFDLSDKSSVELTFDNLDSMPKTAEKLNVFLAQYGVKSDKCESVTLNKTFIPLVIPDSEKSFSVADNTATKGKIIFNFLSGYSLWIVLGLVIIGIAIFFVIKFKKTKNIAEKNEF